MGNSAGLIILLVMLVVVVGFVIITTITGKKAAKKEKEQRYKAVRNEIKAFLAKSDNRKNIRVEFEKVYSRKGPEYKYRDVFDVVVELIEPKTQKSIERRAYEVEGITTKIDKKNYATKWVVNTILDLNETEQRIAIGQKEIKLTKEERKAIKKSDRIKEKELAQIEKAEIKKIRAEAKENKKNPVIQRTTENKEKFVPVRSREKN
ncbi:unknown transmembrane protein [Mesoplasma florum L1]|uniref:Uncharacterized protein n=2 Tax=Mesoplasma florum TaxID=2151 RepID=Q6F153_MESFL|nr:membrane protein [Mesoplasma florum]AAT75770.1 unknown transmembrane protein [Mesoplasma florum L1]AGY41503.1 hypothetical protein mflW37_4360 [Mesoplasma florum W37]ATI73371.1 hypothetical protein CQZ69_02255 [Mesoplasma florum]ATI74052.1 hypothetical protein CQZ70_02215 [Mesoplasma florum]AVN59713.1 hypothetical protein CG008_02285 [Mesoplasma florum]